MKNKALITALCASAFGFAVSSNAGAALLFGYSSFTNNSSSESADLTPVAGFTSTVTKASASSDVNGSSDGLFGLSQYSAATGILNDTPGTGGNGYLNLSSTLVGTSTSFSLTNSTGSIYQLEYLFFDGMRAVNGSGGTIRVRYDLAGGGPTLIGNNSILGASATTNASTDYVDFGSDISEIILADGETVSFMFTGSASDMRLDNIAVTGGIYVPSGVPEPANFAALGGLLISGLVIRSRRRPAKA